jgi:SAM-dependent methyltransferase
LILRELFEPGRCSVLIAGSQDTGLMALVARAAGTYDADITVLDRCASPLQACRRLAREWSLPLKTLHEDLTTFQMQNCFDIIVVHGTLHYVLPECRSRVLAQLRLALRPLGRLVLLFNTGQRVAGEIASEARSNYADWVIDELQRIGIPLPEKRQAFAEKLRMHANRRETREGTFSHPEEVQGLLVSLGFELCDLFELGVDLANPVQNFVAKTSKRRYLAIACAVV